MEASKNNDIIIREFHDDDYDEIAHFWEITGMGNPERDDNKDTIRRTIDIGGNLLVMQIRDTDRICGTSWLTTDGRRMLLHHFGILPEYQGRGLSKDTSSEIAGNSKGEGISGQT